MRLLETYFNPAARGSSVRKECLAGLTSFMAMCYLIFVVPSMLADAGMPKDSAVAATICGGELVYTDFKREEEPFA